MKMITGSLQTKNGKYYAVLNLHENGRRRQKWISTGLSVRGNKKAAAAFLDDLLAVYNKRQERLLRAISKMKHPEEFLLEQRRILALPVCEYILEWIEYRSADLQATTVQGYKGMCSGRLTEYFEPLGTTVYDLTGENLNGFYSWLTRRGLKGSSRQRYHGLIHSAFAFLVKHQYLDSNPCDFADRPKAEKYRAAYYSASELTELFKAAADSPIYIPILLTAHYALRRSEVLGLNWDSIDFENKTLTIRRKVTSQNLKGTGETIRIDSELKTASSVRTFPLIPHIEKMLRDKKYQEEYYSNLIGDSFDKTYDGFVCRDNMGKLIRPNTLSSQLSRLLKEHGLRHIRYHDLRHSCASLLLANDAL